MSDCEFVASVVRESGCWLLLDVNNVYVNAMNRGLDPQQQLRSLPLDRVLEIHLAGHVLRDDGLRIDTHSESICTEVLELYANAVEMTGGAPTLIERDDNFPPLSALLEVARVVTEWGAQAASVSQRFEFERAALSRSRTNAPLELVANGMEETTRLTRQPCTTSYASLQAYQRKLINLLFSRPEPGRQALAHDIYRGMVQRRIEQGIRQALPQTANAAAGDWSALLERFWEEHPPRQPYFWRIPGEFVAWWKEAEPVLEHSPPWSLELAELEWLRRQIKFSVPEKEWQTSSEPVPVDFLERALLVNPSVRLRRFGWPVHELLDHKPTTEIGAGDKQNQGLAASDVWLCTLRAPERDSVATLCLSKPTAELLQACSADPAGGAGRPLRQQLQRLAESNQLEIDATFVVSLCDALLKLADDGVIRFQVSRAGYFSHPRPNL